MKLVSWWILSKSPDLSVHSGHFVHFCLMMLEPFSLVPGGQVHFFRVSGILGFAKSGFGFFRVSTWSGFFVIYRVSGSSGSLTISAVSGTRDAQILCPNFQNQTNAVFQHFRGTKSKVMKRTCIIMIKSFFKMIRISQKCQKSLAWNISWVPAGFDFGLLFFLFFVFSYFSGFG